MMRALRPKHPRRRGSILILTMWITIVLVGVVLVFARSMRVEGMAAANQTASLQADAIAHGAVDYVLSRIDQSQGQLPTDDQFAAEAVSVGDISNGKGGYFWILKHNLDDDQNYYFGLTDEASKLNLNASTTSVPMLQLLPVSDLMLNPDLAQSIVNWRSPNTSDPMDYPDYQPKGGPYETVEELLLIKDLTPAILYGEDTNRNGVLDPNENDGDKSAPLDNHDGHLDRGLFDYVTVYSVEADSDSTGQPRTNVRTVNSSTTLANNLVKAGLTQDRADAIAQALVPPPRRGPPQTQTFTSLAAFYYAAKNAGMTAQEFEQIGDKLTTRPGATGAGGGVGGTTAAAATLTGLVNINTAPHDVLLCLPGMDEGTVQALLAQRQTLASPLPVTPGWVFEALASNQVTARQIANLITTRSFRCSADIIATDAHGRAFRRYYVVFDCQASPPTVLYWQDLTNLGWPLDPQILTDLRAGHPIYTTNPGTTGGLGTSGNSTKMNAGGSL